jgi:hypothetical protein
MRQPYLQIVKNRLQRLARVKGASLTKKKKFCELQIGKVEMMLKKNKNKPPNASKKSKKQSVRATRFLAEWHSAEKLQAVTPIAL